MKTKPVQQLTLSALLIALSVLIPLVMPRIVIGPASFTLASHVPLFVAMFFFTKNVNGCCFRNIFWLFIDRAFHHCFACAIASTVCCFRFVIFTKKRPQIVNHPKKFQLYNLMIAMIHAVAEVIVVAAFFSFWAEVRK